MFRSCASSCVVATHASLGLVQVPDWPKTRHLNVRDLMPVMKQWEPEVLPILGDEIL